MDIYFNNVRAMHREARGATPVLVSIVSRRLVVVQCTCVATNETIKLQNTQSEIRRRRSHDGRARGFRIRPNPEFTKLSMDFQSAIASATSRATSESHPVYARSPRGCDLAAEVTLTGRAKIREIADFLLFRVSFGAFGTTATSYMCIEESAKIGDNRS